MTYSPGDNTAPGTDRFTNEFGKFTTRVREIAKS